jgi:hypothetical protein
MGIGIDLAGALARARQCRVVHGDVKARNVLIGRDGRARLTDFGIARDARAGAEDPVGGSREALTPEQLAGKTVDEQADLFALGCLLYRMLSGHHPFLRDGRLDAERLSRGEPPPLAEALPAGETLPGELLALVDALMSPDPRNRPRNTRGIRQAMRGVMRGIPISAHGKLADEARPLFRPDLPEDIPPQVPEDLGRDGRSRMPPDPDSRLAVWADWYRGLRAAPRRAIGLSVALALALPLFALHNRVTPVRFEEPLLSFDGDVDLPPEVSRRWLVSQVREALAAHVGPLEVVGRVGSGPSLYSDAAPEHDVAIALHCLDGFCVLNLRRETGGVEYLGQGIVAAPLSMEQWRVGLASATAQLFL